MRPNVDRLPLFRTKTEHFVRLLILLLKRSLLFASEEGAISPDLGSSKNMLRRKMVVLARAGGPEVAKRRFEAMALVSIKHPHEKLSFDLCLKESREYPV